MKDRVLLLRNLALIAWSVTELDDLYVYPAKQNLHVTIKDRIDCLISLSDVVDRIHRAGLASVTALYIFKR